MCKTRQLYFKETRIGKYQNKCYIYGSFSGSIQGTVRQGTNKSQGKHADLHTSENMDQEQEHKKETQTNSRNYSGSKSSVVEQLLGSKVMHSSCSSSSSSGRGKTNWKHLKLEIGRICNERTSGTCTTGINLNFGWSVKIVENKQIRRLTWTVKY